MRLLSGMLLMLVLLVLGVVGFIYSGLYNIAASDPHAAPIRWAVHTTMHNSVEVRVADVEPPDLDDQAMITQGARTYEAMCAECHMKPGGQSSALREGLNPTPPSLIEQDDWSPAAQFWIIKHGIKMSGMPAWGETHEDGEIWEMVAFLQKLPTLSEQRYATLSEPQEATSGEDQTADEGNHNADG